MPKAISPLPEAQKPFLHEHSAHHHSAECHARLGSLSDAPAWLRQPFVLTGYRLYYSLMQSIWSIYGIHNETVNIWTHLMPALFFVWDAVSSLHKYSTGELASISILAKILYPLSAAVTLGASSLFHTCNCVDLDTHKRMRTVDFLGISGLIMGSTWAVMHYTFHCLPATWLAYCVILTILSISAFVIPVIPFFHRDVFRVFRVMMHCALASGPIFMAIHAIRLWGSDSPIVNVLFHKIFISYSFYALGIVFYISRFPERLFPGRFDLLGASHQFWHCFVVLGAYATYSGLLDISEHPFATTCAIMSDMM